jgi:hypothetical protein
MYKCFASLICTPFGPKQMTTKEGKEIASRLFSDMPIFPKVLCGLISQYAERVYFQICTNRPRRLILSNQFLFVSTVNWILVYSVEENWKFIRDIGEYGGGVGQFSNPLGMCVYKDQKLIVADHYNRRLQIIDISQTNPNDWKFEPPVYLQGQPTDCHVHRSTMYVTDDYNDQLQAFDINQIQHKQTLSPNFSFTQCLFHVSFAYSVRPFTVTNEKCCIFVGKRFASPGLGFVDPKSARWKTVLEHINVHSMALHNGMLYACDHDTNSVIVINATTLRRCETWMGSLNGIEWKIINGIAVSDEYVFISEDAVGVHIIPLPYSLLS